MIGNRLYRLCKRVERVRDDKITLLRRRRSRILLYGQRKERERRTQDIIAYKKKEGIIIGDGKEQI